MLILLCWKGKNWKSLLKPVLGISAPTPFGFQAPYYVGGGGVGPFPMSSRGRYEHYHAIFDQMQQQKENVFRVAEEREARWRARLQDRGVVERYGHFPLEVTRVLL